MMQNGKVLTYYTLPTSIEGWLVLKSLKKKLNFWSDKKLTRKFLILDYFKEEVFTLQELLRSQ